MKALSIREPYASMILTGKKTIETRTWKTNYRGSVLLCASQRPKGELSGLAFALASIVDCRPMRKSHEKAACCSIYPGAFSWFLEHVYILRPFPVRGRLGLFDVEFPTSAREGKNTGIPGGLEPQKRTFLP